MVRKWSENLGNSHLPYLLIWLKLSDVCLGSYMGWNSNLVFPLPIPSIWFKSVCIVQLRGLDSLGWLHVVLSLETMNTFSIASTSVNVRLVWDFIKVSGAQAFCMGRIWAAEIYIVKDVLSSEVQDVSCCSYLYCVVLNAYGLSPVSLADSDSHWFWKTNVGHVWRCNFSVTFHL